MLTFLKDILLFFLGFLSWLSTSPKSTFKKGFRVMNFLYPDTVKLSHVNAVYLDVKI